MIVRCLNGVIKDNSIMNWTFRILIHSHEPAYALKHSDSASAAWIGLQNQCMRRTASIVLRGFRLNYGEDRSSGCSGNEKVRLTSDRWCDDAWPISDEDVRRGHAPLHSCTDGR